jgi:hypothetical protein
MRLKLWGRDGGPGGMRLRAQIRGPVAACIHINVKQELSQVQAVPKTNTRLASTSSLIRAKACRRLGEAKIGTHPATVGSHTIIIATMGCRFSKQKRAPGPGRHNWFEPSTQGMHAADSRLSPRIFHAADIKPTICEPRACQKSLSQHCAWRQIPHTSILGCFGIRSAPPHTS